VATSGTAEIPHVGLSRSERKKIHVLVLAVGTKRDFSIELD
jgi:hypothetical protein